MLNLSRRVGQRTVVYAPYGEIWVTMCDICCAVRLPSGELHYVYADDPLHVPIDDEQGIDILFKPRTKAWHMNDSIGVEAPNDVRIMREELLTRPLTRETQ